MELETLRLLVREEVKVGWKTKDAHQELLLCGPALLHTPWSGWPGQTEIEIEMRSCQMTSVEE